MKLDLMLRYVPCFYINVKSKLVNTKHRKFYNDDAIHCEKSLRELIDLNLKKRLVGIFRHCKKILLKMNKLQCYKLLKLNIRDIYGYIIDIFHIYLYFIEVFNNNANCCSIFF